MQAINRLEAVIAGEMMALRAGDHSGLGDISHRKNQSLLELTRIGRGIDAASVSGDLRGRLSVLRERLDDNSRLLELHMEATAEVAGLITQAIAEAESDGTYGAPRSGAKRF
ncbi:flagellar protein FlgN [Aureimonas flava]|uniref:Flagellar protein FlgN n=1 Tax=Aureimonas flava TaxID=2320271 RepID=A0A3A1WP07_9HYPH|nr:flagellar protein FlgN [Aureimonas flava]RIY01876.1 flagellar protein FlgN [Aureimonas flava]